MKALIFEGSTKQRIEFMRELGDKAFHQTFIDVIHSIDPAIQCDVATPAFKDYNMLSAKKIQQYDYVLWTGSILNAYDKTTEVLTQVEQAKLVFESGVPFYGSCWGLQIAVIASGGLIGPCKNGLEIGLAKNITLTGLGKNFLDTGNLHPMFKGRGNEPFVSFCVHTAETVELPRGATVLASNEHSYVQALEIMHNNGIFWGVQYHPEVNQKSMVKSITRGQKKYSNKGVLLPNETPKKCVDRIVNGYKAELEDNIRLTEIRNFIEYFSKSKTRD